MRVGVGASAAAAATLTSLLLLPPPPPLMPPLIHYWLSGFLVIRRPRTCVPTTAV